MGLAKIQSKPTNTLPQMAQMISKMKLGLGRDATHLKEKCGTAWMEVSFTRDFVKERWIRLSNSDGSMSVRVDRVKEINDRVPKELK